MVSYRTFYDSKWLRACDLLGEARPVTISAVAPGKVGKESDEKSVLVIRFAEYEKPLGANITNANSIGRIYGPDIDQWVGKRVILFPTTCMLGEVEKECIRIKSEPPQPLVVNPPAASNAAPTIPADQLSQWEAFQKFQAMQSAGK